MGLTILPILQMKELRQRKAYNLSTVTGATNNRAGIQNYITWLWSSSIGLQCGWTTCVLITMQFTGKEKFWVHSHCSSPQGAKSLTVMDPEGFCPFSSAFILKAFGKVCGLQVKADCIIHYWIFSAICYLSCLASQDIWTCNPVL